MTRNFYKNISTTELSVSSVWITFHDLRGPIWKAKAHLVVIWRLCFFSCSACLCFKVIWSYLHRIANWVVISVHKAVELEGTLKPKMKYRWTHGHKETSGCKDVQCPPVVLDINSHQHGRPNILPFQLFCKTEYPTDVWVYYIYIFFCELTINYKPCLLKCWTAHIIGKNVFITELLRSVSLVCCAHSISVFYTEPLQLNLQEWKSVSCVG